MKVNKAKIRREAAAKLAQVFRDSGVEYTCIRSLERVCQPAAREITLDLLARGINLSKSAYSFGVKACMDGMFLRDACIIIEGERRAARAAAAA